MLDILLSQSILAKNDRAITDGKCTVSGRTIMANTIKYKFISLEQEQNLKNQTNKLQSKRLSVSEIVVFKIFICTKEIGRKIFQVLAFSV